MKLYFSMFRTVKKRSARSNNGAQQYNRNNAHVRGHKKPNAISRKRKKKLSMIDANLLYIISFLGFIVSVFISWFVKLHIANPGEAFRRYLQYPLLFPSRGIGLTRFEALALVSFLSANGLIIFLPSFFPGWREVQRRAAMAALVNLVPLSMGGRSVIIDILNMPESWKKTLHIFSGSIVVVECLLHTIITVSLNPKPGQLTTSGWAASGILLAGTLSAMPPVRRRFGKWFMTVHRALFIGFMSTLLWHILRIGSQRARVLAWVSISIWSSTTSFRIFRIWRYSVVAEIVRNTETSDATMCEVRLERAVKIHPGAYFYIYFPDGVLTSCGLFRFNYTRSFTAMAMWHPTEETRLVTSISFLLSRHCGQASTVARLGEGKTILLDGPYGQDLRLQDQETVVLVAKGVGIAAILPLALDLGIRKHHDNCIRDGIQGLRDRLRALESSSNATESAIRQEDVSKEISDLQTIKLFRDTTKKVVLLWSLERNSNMDWVQRELQQLQELDEQHRVGFDPFKISKYWMCLNPNGRRSFDSTIISMLKQERATLPGRMTVVVSGDEAFRRLVRNGVVDGAGVELIHYHEAAYQPWTRGQRPRYPVQRVQNNTVALQDIRSVTTPKRAYSVASMTSIYSSK
ncbi:hypothetical protein NLG97_g1510 [Lecanicillium saksenae]|uniref:Uncharacterized protein n=1 Tax=Lecanicillium saksenae TaxID=468837 RepID=A0ACC1R5G0_9HYPO|nr:hypothetical protein NLG97_g1510 [Lecanicillium saksenae]